MARITAFLTFLTALYGLRFEPILHNLSYFDFSPKGDRCVNLVCLFDGTVKPGVFPIGADVNRNGCGFEMTSKASYLLLFILIFFNLNSARGLKSRASFAPVIIVPSEIGIAKSNSRSVFGQM